MLGSISGTAEKIRLGDLSPVEVFEALKSSIEKHDGRIKSYTSLNEKAESDAVLLSKLADEGKFRGPLHGIPLSVKDLIDTAGLRTTYGNESFSSNVPVKNAVVVDNLLSSGSYVIGKTNTHEFALGAETPPTGNPFDIDRVPGGSSGGSAAALAADMALLALGTDTGGSIRIPAAWCGVTGLKPTYGMVSAEGVFPESWSLDHVGPMVRYAEDIPLVMKAMGVPLAPFEIKTPMKAVFISDFFEESNQKVSAGVREAVRVLESSGIIEVSDFNSGVFPESLALHEKIDLSEIATIHGVEYRAHRRGYMKTSMEQIEAGLQIPAHEYIAALRQRDALYSRLCRELGDVDVLISPTLPETAPLRTEFSGMSLADHDDYVKFQAEFNYLGMPALSVPCGFVDSMPVGLQVISRRNEDSKAVAVGIELQRLTSWHLTRPSL